MLWVDSSRNPDSSVEVGRGWIFFRQDHHLHPPCQGEWVSLLGELGGTKPGDHQLRQHCPRHAHRLPVRHHGGLDPYPLLGAFHLHFQPQMSMSLSRLSGRKQISCFWVTPLTIPTHPPPFLTPTSNPLLPHKIVDTMKVVFFFTHNGRRLTFVFFGG